MNELRRRIENLLRLLQREYERAQTGAMHAYADGHKQYARQCGMEADWIHKLIKVTQTRLLEIPTAPNREIEEFDVTPPE